jgi:hypothetical protein
VTGRLRSYSDRIVIADCRRLASVRGRPPDDLTALDRYIDPGSEVLVTTRLDSDDALNRHAVELVQRHITAFHKSDDAALLHSFPFGCKLDVQTGGVYRTRYQQNAFLSLFERPGGPDVQGVLRDNHTQLEKSFPLTRDFSLLGWLQVLHGTNVSNAVNRNDEPTHGLDLQALFSQDPAVVRGGPVG